jgi:hypothetical protein
LQQAILEHTMNTLLMQVFLVPFQLKPVATGSDRQSGDKFRYEALRNYFRCVIAVSIAAPQRLS